MGKHGQDRRRLAVSETRTSQSAIVPVPVEVAPRFAFVAFGGVKQRPDRPKGRARGAVVGIAKCRKAFKYAGNLYAIGDRFPQYGEPLPEMMAFRGLIDANLIEPDRIPGPSERVGEGRPIGTPWRPPHEDRVDMAAAVKRAGADLREYDRKRRLERAG